MDNKLLDFSLGEDFFQRQGQQNQESMNRTTSHQKTSAP